MDRNGGKYGSTGAVVFGTVAGRTGRGEETRVATLPKISGRVLTLSGCARKTGRVQLAKQQGLQATRRSHRARRCRALNASKGGRGEGGGGGGGGGGGRRR